MSHRARGAGSNPQSRFERLRYDASLASEPGPEGEPGSDPRTVLLRDPSRSIVARNESPDVGFEASVNPYRGCEHGCVYCLLPDTPVLCEDLVWRPLGSVREGDRLLGFEEQARPGRERRLRVATVEGVFWSRRPTWRIVTEEGEIQATAEHRFVDEHGRWTQTRRLRPGRALRRTPRVPTEVEDEGYRAGYVAGLSLGDGTFRDRPGWRSDKLGFPAAYWRVASIDREPLERAVAYLRSFGVETTIRPFQGGPSSRQPMLMVETRSLTQLSRIGALLEERMERSWRRGFVAGFFDAEGHNGTSLRISQLDVGTLERIRSYLLGFGFAATVERRPQTPSALRLVGSTRDRLRFFATFQPAIRRKREALLERRPDLASDPVLRMEPGGVAEVVDIRTSSRTFFAAGFATHNCYARPTHEYLGFSAGLDFETRILVKEDAPELLRAALSSPRWTPTVLALSGVTDPYQPAERRLRITRRILEVLVEFRNPVAVVTKGFAVTRDVDLLAELARHRAASVAISVTTLDPELQRAMEPRASPPRLRLTAIEKLAAAGVPVGVMVAPIVPGLTDHEVPRILEAAAGAGASFAGRVMLRLPHGVKQLFEEWLATHFPERREKVLARLRSLHGGRLYDSRFGHRQRGAGPFAEQIGALFELARRRAGLAPRGPELSIAAFRRPGAQGRLFE